MPRVPIDPHAIDETHTQLQPGVVLECASDLMQVLLCARSMDMAPPREHADDELARATFTRVDRHTWSADGALLLHLDDDGAFESEELVLAP